MIGNRLEYDSVNKPVLDLIPTVAHRILDIGCGVGTLGRAVKIRQSAEVVGLTFSTGEAERASKVIDRVVVQDLEAFNPSDLGKFDCVVCSHVLEHIRHPEKVLNAVRLILEPDGFLITALPNVLVWRQRLKFTSGYFRYTEGGLMDKTHYRFFDWKTAQDLVRNAGFQLLSVHSDGMFPLSRFLPLGSKLLDRFALSILPGLFAWQVVIKAVSCRTSP